MNYSQKLRDPRWQARRLEIFQRDHFHCRSCNDDKTTLCVHHLRYAGNPWDVPAEDLVTLCEHCHAVVEKYKNLINRPPSIDSKIIKIKDDYNVVVVVIEDIGISFFEVTQVCELILFIRHKNFSTAVHGIIDYWLQNDYDHLLKDSKYEDVGIPILTHVNTKK